YATHLLEIIFFFQAEDGIRDRNVTGVQTCALPITYRKEELYNALIDPNIKAIFDLSGGDLALEVLNQFTEDDWRAIESISDKFYLGYSDNTVIINALLLKTNVKAVNFLATNIVKDKSGVAKDSFKRVLFNNERIDRGSTTPNKIDESAIIIGGNIRCYLK